MIKDQTINKTEDGNFAVVLTESMTKEELLTRYNSYKTIASQIEAEIAKIKNFNIDGIVENVKKQIQEQINDLPYIEGQLNDTKIMMEKFENALDIKADENKE